jgi:hypothetical protein
VVVRATLEDSDALYKIVDSTEMPHAIRGLLTALRSPYEFVFINSAETAIVRYSPVLGDIPWINTHTWSLKEVRGKALGRFFIETGIWMCERTHYNVFTSFIPREMRHQGLFLAHIGAERQCSIDGTTLYTFNRTDLEHFKEKLKW